MNAARIYCFRRFEQRCLRTSVCVIALICGACGSKTEAPAPTTDTTPPPAAAPAADAAAAAADAAAAAADAATAADAAASAAAAPEAVSTQPYGHDTGAGPNVSTAPKSTSTRKP
jgi:hypothetical protein